MNALEALAKLREAGIGISAQDGKLRLKASKGALSDELRAAITEHKDAILMLLGSGSEPLPQLLPRSGDAGELLPLSYAQQRLWFLDELEPGTPLYNMPFALKVKGRLDTAVLQSALNDLALRQESLRTIFTSTESNPAQRVLANTELALPVEDHRGDDPSLVIERLRELARTRFDLAAGPLLKLNALQTGDNEYVLMLVIHHIVSDLWSMEIFFRDLGRWYEYRLGKATEPPASPPVQYADYALWQRQLLGGDRLRPQLDYWLKQLENAPPVLELPTDRPRPAEPEYRGSWQSVRLPASLNASLHAIAKSSGCTLFMLTFSAFAALLHKYSGEDDLVIGTPISGRHHTELEQLIGFFLNTLALRVTISPSTTFWELLAQVKRTALDAYANQDLPFEKLVEELQPDRDMSRTPVFQHMFIWQESTAKPIKLADLSTETATLIGHDTAKFDLTLAMTNGESGIEAGIEYNTDLYNADTIERMLTHLQVLLTELTAKPDSCLADLQLLDETERKLVTDTFNATDVDFGGPGCVHELVAAQARRSPEAIAVESGNEILSYAELERRSSRLAWQLQQLGASPGSIIAISCERSLELPVAALAVLKAGACYLAVDPHYPAERIAAMLEDSGAAIVLTQTGIDLPRHDAQTIRLDEFDFSGPEQSISSAARPQDALYCIYTSGSTGKPKGVQLAHAGLWNLLRWQQQHARLGTAARTLQFASFSFDVSFQEMFSTWSTGGTLLMVDEELRQDLPRLATFIAEEKIQRLYLPYAALQPIAETLVSLDLSPALQDIVVAGEALQVTPIVRALFSKLAGAALHNQYGPSETHVVTALTLTGSADSWPALPSIGTPVANTRAYVLDTKLQPAPVGVPGELYIGGIQVGIGYLQRPELNAEKFIPSPFRANDRLYKTGDRVRHTADGALEFLGRADDQVKWRGFRVEPGEIEAALLGLPEVAQAAVMVRSDDAPGIPRLVGYVTGSEQLDSTALREALKDKLPDYMVPSIIVIMDTLPLTPSGKVARRKLPPPEYSRDELTPYAAPRNPVEQELVDIWSQVLGLERPGINDDFFELGGHSLLATQLVSRVRDHFHISLPLKFIFRYPTPASLAETVTTLQGALQKDVVDTAGERDEFRI